MLTGGQMDTVNVELFGKDPKIQKAVVIAKNVSVVKAPVLVTGEAGLGKRTLAKYIHQNSNRANGPFQVVDCAQDSTTVENRILGYRDEEGRFHKGILESANKGTVVFANVESLEDEFQKKLHKILNELEDYDLDVRIIATTTKNLSKLVGAGRFYRGLYMMISNNNITLTPLRERVNDLEMLARQFAQECSDNEETITIDQTAMDKILNHYWTHNVHELRSVIESSIANCETATLTETDLEIGEKKAVNMIADDDSEGIRLMSLKEAEKLLIQKALVHTSENRTQAAKILGVSIRTLRNKINEYRSAGSAFFVNLR